MRKAVPYAVLFETWMRQRALNLPRSFTDRYRNWLLRHARFRLAISQRAKGYARSIGFDGTAVHANVCDVEKAMQSKRCRAAVSGRPFTVLYCGGLAEWKGVRLVLETATKCSEDDTHFVIMGSGALESEVKEAVAKLPFVSSVGGIAGPEQFEIMGQSDVLLLPSLIEPWGVVVHEALSVGTLVIVSPHVGCIPDFVDGNEVGVVAAPDADALRNAIVDVRSRSAQDPSLPDRCTAAARQYTYETATRELCEAISDGI
jgi:glycosyltransferase involved in cell wall biosynthesis